MHTFSSQKLEALVIPAGLYPQIIVQDVGIHAGGGAGNFFPLPLTPINVSPGVNCCDFNYSMELTLLGVQPTIKHRCASTNFIILMQ